MSTVTASIVVGAERHLIHDCVASLVASAGDHDLAIVLTGNEPAGGIAAQSVEVHQGISFHVQLNAEPHGFAANHNRALRNSESDYYLIANDDLVFRDRAAANCIDFLNEERNQRIAAVSPRLLNSDGSLQRSTYQFPTILRALLDLSGLRSLIPHNSWTDRVATAVGRGYGRSRFWAHDSVCDVDTFRGAAMFVRRSAWDEVGELSEVTRVGGEIAEWHRRCREAGWRVVFYPDAEVIHFGSQTVGRDRLLKSEYLKGYLFYFSRYSSRPALFSFRLLGSVIALMRLALSVLASDRTDVRLWRQNLSLLTQPAWSDG